MPRRRWSFQKLLVLILVFLSLFGPRIGKAQEPTTRGEFWPEIDVYINVKPKVRIYLLGTVSKTVEDGEIFRAQSYEAQIGAHVDYKLNDHVIFRVGYRYGSGVGSDDDGFREHRFLTDQTLRKMLPGKLLLSDRNREDFRFIRGDFSFRYRNRVTIEKEFNLFKERTTTPYASAEVFYDTRYDTWNRNRWAVGIQQSLRRGPLRRMLLPKHDVILDIYFMRQNESRANPPHVNALGAVLAFYF